MSLGQKTVLGIIWNFSETLARRGVNILVTLVLAKLLVPEDFGLIALMSVFLTLATTLMESGFRQALIRTPNITEGHYNTGFYSNIALGLLAYLLVFISAPFIADFYDQPKLKFLLRIISIGIIIDAFQVVQRASLSKAINFKVQMKAALPAGIISGLVAIFLAYMGAGVYALVMQVLVNSLAITILLWLFQKWRPLLLFDWTLFKEMYSFGYKIFLSRTIDTIFKNIYVIVIAKIFSASVLGLYFFADQIKTLIAMQLVNSIQTVTFPALSSIQQDEQLLKKGYKKVISVTTFLLFPVMMFLGALAPQLFEIFFEEKWHEAAFYLQLLCIVGVLYPLHSLNLNIMKVKGRSDIYLRVTILKQTILVAILYISISYGIEGILYGQIINSIIAYFINAHSSGILIRYSILEQLKDILPVFLVALFSSVIGFLLIKMIDFPPIYSVPLIGTLMVGAYLLLSYFFRLDGFIYGQQQLLKKLKK